MLKVNTLDEFTHWLGVLVARVQRQGRGALPFAQMQLQTGLRSAEVLEFSRWVVDPSGLATVQLAKSDAKRTFQLASLPSAWVVQLTARPGMYQYTYASYMHDLKAAGISFIFAKDKKATLSHAFRYHMFRRLYEASGDVATVQTEMAHKSAGSTMYYLLDAIHVQDARPWLGP